MVCIYLKKLRASKCRAVDGENMILNFSSMEDEDNTGGVNLNASMKDSNLDGVKFPHIANEAQKYKII